MATALVEGTQILEWGGLNLHGQLAGWRDRRVRRIAQHKFDRRDGGQNEDMGREVHVTDCNLLFDGAEGLALLRRFLKLWDENPTRLFVHPIFGRMNATFLGVESGTLTVDSGANLYTVQGQFVENNVNADVLPDAGQSVTSRAAAVDSQALLVTAEVDTDVDFSTASLRTTVATFTTAASLFSTAAAATTASVDPSLSGLLTGALTASAAAIAAIRAAADDSPVASDAVIACEILTAYLVDLGAACLARRPSIIDFQVGETAHLLAIAGQIYAGNAISRLTEMRSLNPSLQGLIVPAGTTLQLAAA